MSNATPSPMDATDENNNQTDTVETEDSKVSQPNVAKHKFQIKWMKEHHWLQYDDKLNLMHCKLCRDLGFKNTMALGTANYITLIKLFINVNLLSFFFVKSLLKNKSH